MRDLTSVSGPTGGASAARRAWLLFTLAALLVGVSPHAAAVVAHGQKAADADAQRKTEQELEKVTERGQRLTVSVKPFEDLALRGKQLVDEGRLGPETTFEVSMTAAVAADGRLQPETAQFSWHKAADEPLTDLVRQLATAVSESRIFGGLEGVKTVRLGLKLDRQNASAQVEAEMPSAAEAEKYANGYGALIQIARISKRGTAEGALYERVRFVPDGKVFKMSFEIPREEAARLLGYMLTRMAEKKAEQDPR